MTLTRGQTFKLGEVKFKWNPKSKWIFVTIGEKRERVLKTELWMMMYSISQEKEQDDLVPVVKKDMMQFDRVHTIEATADIKKGEKVKFHCHVDVPLTIVESQLTLGDVKELQAKAERNATVIPSVPIQGGGAGVK